MEGVKATWFSGTEDELVRELLDDESPLLFLQEDPEQGSTDEPAMNQLISTYYSGPTIQDIENALSTTSQKVQSPQRAVSQARIAMLERNLSKMENNKYTLKLKSCGDGMADDGYKWRKYGQKSIKNSPYPRSYYRCVNRRCSAKKHVERSTEDKDTLVITYEGLHLHFAHPHFLVDQPHSMYSSFKKPKRAISGSESKNPEAQQSGKEARESIALSSPVPSLGTLEDPTQELGAETLRGPQGLLEDVVPFMIRNPSTNIASSNSSSCSSYRSPPPSPSSLSWSPVYPYSCFDIGINH